ECRLIVGLICQIADALHYAHQQGVVHRDVKPSNILPVIDSGEEDGVPFIVMPLVDGCTIDRLVGPDASRVGAVPECRLIVGLICQIADALHYAHQQGVVHRDVKPSNILCDRQGRAYLSDFGIARPIVYIRRLTAPHQILGTAEYLSPEQLRGEEAGAASDQYSLAVVLYQLLTGQTPFQGSLNEVGHQHLHADPIPPIRLKPDIGEELNAVVLTGLRKNPADRYGSLAELARAARASIATGGDANHQETVWVSMGETPIRTPTDYMSPGLREPARPEPLGWQESVRLLLRPTMARLQWVARDLAPRVLERTLYGAWNVLIGFWHWLVELREAVEGGDANAIGRVGLRAAVSMTMLILLYAWLSHKFQGTLFSPIGIGAFGLSVAAYIWLNWEYHIYPVSATNRKETSLDAHTSIRLFTAGLSAPLAFILVFLWRLHGYDAGDGSLIFLAHAALLALGIFALALGYDFLVAGQRLNALLGFVFFVVCALGTSPDKSIVWTIILCAVVVGDVRAANWFWGWRKRVSVGAQPAYQESTA
ncbi:MAG: protein kinase, partial [Chloroflexi bacterium]|nr:protein kinase [Chloroflexota bacterium]